MTWTELDSRDERRIVELERAIIARHLTDGLSLPDLTLAEHIEHDIHTLHRRLEAER